MESAYYYPIYLQLRDQPCVVVGGGKIAEGKVEGLLTAGAQIKIIAPDLTPALQTMVQDGQVAYVQREYEHGDLTGAFMVICATDKREVNHQVWEEANANHQLVNVVDDTPYCNFIAPSIMRQGDLTIAISTGGRAPVLAVRLKERFQREIGPHYAHFLRLAGKLRAPLASRIPNFETRKALWYQLIDSGILELLEQGDEPAALRKISDVMGFEFEPDRS